MYYPSNLMYSSENFLRYQMKFKMRTQWKQECIQIGCVPSAAVTVSPATHAPPLPCMHPLSPRKCPHCHACPPLLPYSPPLRCGQNDRRLWKYYLSATTVADGKYWYDDSRLEVAWDNNLFLSWYPALVMKHSVIDFHYVSFKILLLQVRIYGK